MTRGELADHLRDVGAIEWAQRDDAVVRAQAPRRSELGPRGREDEHRRLRAALGERLHQIERGRVGPVQVLERERDGLRTRPGEKPRDQRRELPSPELLGRQIGGAARRRRDVDKRRNERRMFGGIETDQLQCVLEIGEALARGRVGVAETLAAPFGDRVQRRILQQLRRREFGPGVRRLAEARVKLLDEPRLADPGLADDLHELSLTGPRALPAPRQEVKLLRTPHQRGWRSRAAAPPAAARAHDAIKRHRRRHALERVRADVLGDEQPGDLALHGCGGDDRTRIGHALRTGGDIRRLAEHFARRVHHHRAGIEADAGGELRRARSISGVEFSQGALDREGGAHRALGVVLLCLRIAEERHQPVAELLQHMPAERSHRLRGFVEICAYEVAPILGV